MFKHAFIIAGIASMGAFFGVSVVHADFPNDPRSRQWSYDITDTYRAWQYTSGSPKVVVAIVDNGFDETHPDLRDALWVNKNEIPDNGIDDDKNGFIDDIHGWDFVKKKKKTISENSTNPYNEEETSSIVSHATVVAGIIGATGNNYQDGVGVAYGVKLMNLKVIDTNGLGEVEPLVQAIHYAVDNGATVINISMVGYGSATTVRQAIEYAYQKGVVVVGSAGNDRGDLDTEPEFPICSDVGDPYTAIIGVSAIDTTRKLAVFSNVGSSCVDITAPGVDIAGPVRVGADKNGTTISYKNGWNGTSFSAPFISAAAALVKSVQPTWNVDQIIRTLKSTVRHTLGSDETLYAAAYGKGLLQIGSAIESAQNGSVLDPRLFMEGEKDLSFVAPRRILVTAQGSARYIDMLQGNKIQSYAPGFSNALTFTTYRDSAGTIYYVVVKKKNGREDLVSVYGRTWEQLFEWSVPHGVYQVLALDMAGTSDKEIVLIDQNSGKIAFFTPEGKIIKTAEGINSNAPSFGAIRHHHGSDHNSDKDELIIVSHKVDSTTVVKRITSPTSTPEVLFETRLKSVGSITYLYDKSVDKEFIIIGSDIGASSLVNVFSFEGSVINSFRPYDLAFRGGVQVSSIVYGEGGVEHVVVTPKRGVQSLRVYDSEGSRVLDMSLDTVLSQDKNVITSVALF